MSTVQITKRMTEASPRIRSGFIAVYYLLTILTGAFVLWFHGRLAVLVDLGVGTFYLVVTVFLYAQSASANRSERR
jgi:hypothetical protein